MPRPIVPVFRLDNDKHGRIARRAVGQVGRRPVRIPRDRGVRFLDGPCERVGGERRSVLVVYLGPGALLSGEAFQGGWVGHLPVLLPRCRFWT
jgi:hypothetical protein